MLYTQSQCEKGATVYLPLTSPDVCMAYVLLLFHIYFFIFIFNDYVRPVTATSAGLIFIKFARLVELWL